MASVSVLSVPKWLSWHTFWKVPGSCSPSHYHLFCATVSVPAPVPFTEHRTHHVPRQHSELSFLKTAHSQPASPSGTPETNHRPVFTLFSSSGLSGILLCFPRLLSLGPSYWQPFAQTRSKVQKRTKAAKPLLLGSIQQNEKCCLCVCIILKRY